MKRQWRVYMFDKWGRGVTINRWRYWTRRGAEREAHAQDMRSVRDGTEYSFRVRKEQ